MRILTGACALVILSAPFSVLAEVNFPSGFPFGNASSFVEDIVRSVTEDAASTSAITTSGDSGASVFIRTRVNADTTGTRYETEVHTEVDGVVHRESSRGIVGKGTPFRIHIATSSKASGGSEARAFTWVSLGQSTTSKLQKPAFSWFSFSENQSFRSLFERFHARFFSE